MYVLQTHHNVQWEGLVRDTSVLSKTTSFKVRESSGQYHMYYLLIIYLKLLVATTCMK